MEIEKWLLLIILILTATQYTLWRWGNGIRTNIFGDIQNKRLQKQSIVQNKKNRSGYSKCKRNEQKIKNNKATNKGTRKVFHKNRN